MEFKALGNLSLVQQQFTVSITVIKLEIAENNIWDAALSVVTYIVQILASSKALRFFHMYNVLR